MINFPFGTNGKAIIVGVPILKHITVCCVFSGIPETVPASSVNRQCGSGLQAFMNIAGIALKKKINSDGLSALMGR